MICIFEVSSPEDAEFKRIIHVDGNHTFESLHQLIQDSVDFDQSQLASFFFTDELSKRKMEICFLDAGSKCQGKYSMRDTKIASVVTEPGHKLVYVFDFFNERLFYFDLKERIMKADLKEPFVAYEKGNTPAQFLINDYDTPEVELMEVTDTYKSFGDLEDYYEIFGEMDS